MKKNIYVSIICFFLLVMMFSGVMMKKRNAAPMKYWQVRFIRTQRKHRRYNHMKRKEMINKVANLNCMLKCLRAIDSDDVEAIQSIPQALIIVSEYADTIYEAIIDSDDKTNIHRQARLKSWVFPF